MNVFKLIFILSFLLNISPIIASEHSGDKDAEMQVLAKKYAQVLPDFHKIIVEIESSNNPHDFQKRIRYLVKGDAALFNLMIAQLSKKSLYKQLLVFSHAHLAFLKHEDSKKDFNCIELAADLEFQTCLGVTSVFSSMMESLKQMGALDPVIGINASFSGSPSEAILSIQEKKQDPLAIFFKCTGGGQKPYTILSALGKLVNNDQVYFPEMYFLCGQILTNMIPKKTNTLRKEGEALKRYSGLEITEDSNIKFIQFPATEKPVVNKLLGFIRCISTDRGGISIDDVAAAYITSCGLVEK